MCATAVLRPPQRASKSGGKSRRSHIYLESSSSLSSGTRSIDDCKHISFFFFTCHNFRASNCKVEAKLGELSAYIDVRCRHCRPHGCMHNKLTWQKEHSKVRMLMCTHWLMQGYELTKFFFYLLGGGGVGVGWR